MPEAVLDENLLAAGRRAFKRFGYRGATIERIAGEAGVSRVTLHRRGISKDAILTELSDRATERYRAALWPALTGTGTGRERIEAALDALCNEAEANLDLLVALRAQADALFHEQVGGEALTRSVFTEPLERLLLDGERDGSLRAVDPTETATVVFNLVGWTYIHLRTDHRWNPRRARRATLDVVLNGIVTR